MRNLSSRFTSKRRHPDEKKNIVDTEQISTNYGTTEKHVHAERPHSAAVSMGPAPTSASPLFSRASNNEVADSSRARNTDSTLFQFPPEEMPQFYEKKTPHTSPRMSSRQRITSPKTPPLPKVADSIIIDFQKEPFQFYTREIETSWRRSLRQAILIVCACFFVPAVFIGFAMLINERSINKRMSRTGRKKEHVAFILLLIMTVIKDAIVVTIALHVTYGSPISNYEIAYPPIVYFWCLVSFAFPLLVFYFASVNYVFGFVSDKKTLQRLVSSLWTTKGKEEEMKKVNDQEKYFHDNYEDLSSIKSTYNEINFLADVTPKRLWVTSIMLSLIVCITHSVIPLVFYDCFSCKHYANHLNVSRRNNKTTDYRIQQTIIGMSAVNSFLVSLLAASYFSYIILWQAATLREWKRFNSTEKDTKKTLLNNGPQGIAMWWKIYQTLKFFSSSSICVSVLISKLACIVAVILIVCQSVGLMYPITYSSAVNINTSTATLFLMDNILLFFGLLIIASLSLMISREKKLAKYMIQIKKLNVSYELSSTLTIETDVVDKEQGIPIRSRGLRGCLVLLQELTCTLESVESNVAYTMLICCLVATIFVFPSTFLTTRYLTLKY